MVIRDSGLTSGLNRGMSKNAFCMNVQQNAEKASSMSDRSLCFVTSRQTCSTIQHTFSSFTSMVSYVLWQGRLLPRRKQNEEFSDTRAFKNLIDRGTFGLIMQDI